MGKVIRNVLISVAAVVVFVGAGFAIGSTGFRWTQFFRDGFWGFTSHQWGILASGALGAVLAIVGVAVTLMWQRRQFVQEQQMIELRENRSRSRQAVSKLLDEVHNLGASITQHGDGSLSFGHSRHIDELVKLAGSLLELDDDATYLSVASLDLAEIARAIDSGAILNVDVRDNVKTFTDSYSKVQACIASWNAQSGESHDELISSINAAIHRLRDLLHKVGYPIVLPSERAAMEASEDLNQAEP